jgi:lipoprotein-anchoring transpeptidase ErfK/SrfK
MAWKVVLAAVAVVLAATQPAAAGREGNCAGLLQCLFSEREALAPGGRGVIAYAAAARYPVGAIVVDTPARRLYLVLPGGKAIGYAIGVGREGFAWSGVSHVERKAEWPGWAPPSEMIARERASGHFIPDYLEGGPHNPLGARALYLAGTLYRIHGTNQPSSIGHAVSSGCIRMLNEDVIDLYERVSIGAPVYVHQ